MIFSADDTCLPTSISTQFTSPVKVLGTHQIDPDELVQVAMARQ